MPGPRLGLGLVSLVALFAFALGVAAGGVILPYLRATVPADVSIPKAVSTQPQPDNLVSILPQTIMAELAHDQEPISTNLSVEAFLTDIELKAIRQGLVAKRSAVATGSGYEIRFVFSAKAGKSVTLPRAGPLLLRFQPGPQMGTMLLVGMSQDGEDWSAGRRLASLVRAGALIPPLPANQVLTPAGLVHVEPAPAGPLLYLDGSIVLPKGAAANSGASADPDRPRFLALSGAWPQDGPLADWVFVVSDLGRPSPCSAKLYVLQAGSGSVIEAPLGLAGREIRLTHQDNRLFVSGFCAPNGSPIDGPVGQLDLTQGKWVWQVSAKSTSAASVPDPVAAQGWRQTSPSRIASLLGPKGALASLACRPDTGYTVALSGLPAPTQGNTARIEVVSGGKTAQLVMNWRPSVRGYEAVGRARQAATDPVLSRFLVDEPIEFRSLSGRVRVPPPGRDQVSSVIARCGAPAMER